MHVNPRVFAATIAVAVATFLFSMVALPLVPIDSAHAQERPSTVIEFDPSHKTRMGEELNPTLILSGLSAYNRQTDLAHDVYVITCGYSDALECDSTGTGDGGPELSANMDVSVTATKVNQAPQVDGIPDVNLNSDDLPWLVDLGMYFTDPDGDDLEYDFSGQNITEVALAHLDDSTLSIDPVSGGEVSFYVVATDSGGLSAVTSVAVSVTEPEPAPTPAPVVVLPLTAPTAPEPALAPESDPTFKPLSPLVERKIRNQTQKSDSVSRLIVGFALEPVPQPAAEVTLPTVAESPAPQKISPVHVVATDGHAPAPQSASLDASGGGFTIWPILLLAMIALVTSGYAVRMYVVHRL